MYGTGIIICISRRNTKINIKHTEEEFSLILKKFGFKERVFLLQNFTTEPHFR